MNLEEEWNSTIMVKTLPLLESSPRTLMSSLQHRRSRSPSDEIVTWKVRTNDLAVMEILRERRAAIESGKLKGRRLFEEFGGLNNNEDCEVRSVSVTSYDDSSSSCASVGVCVTQMMDGEKAVAVAVAAVVEEKHKRGVTRLVVLVLLAVGLLICAIGITCMMRRSYRDEYEVTLVPT